MAEPAKHSRFVASDSGTPEFAFRPVFLGVLMAVAMSADNTYHGLKAGMAIAARYTTAVIGMAVLGPVREAAINAGVPLASGLIGVRRRALMRNWLGQREDAFPLRPD